MLGGSAVQAEPKGQPFHPALCLPLSLLNLLFLLLTDPLSPLPEIGKVRGHPQNPHPIFFMNHTISLTQGSESLKSGLLWKTQDECQRRCGN